MSRLAVRLAAAAAPLLVAATAAAQQHELRAHLAPSGIDFIEAQVPSYVPTTLQPPEFRKSFACAEFIQRDTTVHLSLDRIDFSMPGPDRLRVEIDISGSADGELHAEDVYVCAGSETCQDSVTLDRATAILEYEMVIVGGRPQVMAREVSLEVSEDDIQIAFSDCGIVDNALNTGISFAKGWLLDFLESKVEEIARDKLSGMLEDVLASFAYNGSIGSTEFTVGLDSLVVEPNGIGLGAYADIFSDYEAAACIRDTDPGDPFDQEGAAPDLAAGANTQLSFALNLGLLDDALYHAWRKGLTCLSDEHVAALGLEIDYDHLMGMMPGFPPGTEMDFQVRLTAPPRVVGNASADAVVTIVLDGIEIDVIGARPDGTTNVLHAEADVEATAAIGIDPGSNAVLLGMRGATIKRLVMEDERSATEQGFDVARIVEMAHDVMLPKVMEEMGEMAIAGPVFTFADYAIILRELSTTSAYLTLGADLFRIPANDTIPPNTSILSAPAGIVAPDLAVLRFGGEDGEVPSELLRYQVTVDGEVQPESFIREMHIGEVGVTKSYRVHVAAIDLSGNVDATPAKVTIEVDGVAPSLAIDGMRSRNGTGGATELVTWTMGDDRTEDSAIAVRLDVYRVVDPSDVLTAELSETIDLPAGATSAEVGVEAGGVYRIEVVATDGAGNESSSSLLLEVPDAGCSVAGASGRGAGLLVLLALALAARRRRQ